MGFTIQAILGFIIGGAFNPLTNNAFGAFVFLYGLFVAVGKCPPILLVALTELTDAFVGMCDYIVGEVGPGSCVILVSGESFPTPIRGRTYPLLISISIHLSYLALLNSP